MTCSTWSTGTGPRVDRWSLAGLDRDAACEVARTEARKRNAGRMFLAGSEPGPIGDVVLIVESEPQVV